MRANDLIIIQESITDKYSVFFGNISRDNLFRHGTVMKQVEIHPKMINKKEGVVEIFLM